MMVVILSCYMAFADKTAKPTSQDCNDLDISYSDNRYQYVYPDYVSKHNAHPGNDYVNVIPKKDGYGLPIQTITVIPPPIQKVDISSIADTKHNPLLAALLLSTSLGIPDRPIGYNHPELLPLNPYVALLLSHYGRYVAVPGVGRSLYGYGAVNNYHNNKPFGAYKIYEDSDG